MVSKGLTYMYMHRVSRYIVPKSFGKRCCHYSLLYHLPDVSVSHVQSTVVVYEEDERVQICALLSQTAEKEVAVTLYTQDGNATGMTICLVHCMYPLFGVRMWRYTIKHLVSRMVTFAKMHIIAEDCEANKCVQCQPTYVYILIYLYGVSHDLGPPGQGMSCQWLLQSRRCAQ